MNMNVIPDYSLIRNLPGLIFIKDINSIYLGMNRSFAELVGCKTADYLIGKSDHDIPSDVCQFAPRFIALDKQTIESKQELLTLEIQPFANGWGAVLVKRHLLKNDDGLVIGTVAHLMDVSKTPFYHSYLNFNVSDNELVKTRNKANIYLLTDEKPSSASSLTERQQECLFFLLRGKTAKQIGSILNISKRTVETHFEKIKNVFNCYSKCQLIEKALQEGFFHHIPKRLANNHLDKWHQAI